MSKLLTIFRANKSPFRPTNIDGLQLWLDAADTSTITESGGDVSQWNDKSGNEYVFTQDTALNQPVTNNLTKNNLNVIEFDGANWIEATSLSLPSGNSSRTVFWVAKYDQASTEAYAWAWGERFTNKAWGWGHDISSSEQLSGFANDWNTQAPNVGTWQVRSVTFNGSNVNFYRSGTQYGPHADTYNTSATPMRIGTYLGNSTGEIWHLGEFLIYDSALSDTDREAVESYLADKWGISIPGSLGQFTWDSNTSSPAASQTSTRTVTNTHLGMKRCIVNDAGVVQYYLNPFDSTEKADGTAANLDGTDGQVMVEIPKFYTRRTVSGTETTWSISDRPRIGFSVHPAFVKDGVEVDYRYYGAYHASVYAPATGSITATTEDNPVKITSNNHGLETNCQVTITGTGITELDDESFVVTKVDSNNFTLNGLDGTGIGTSATGSWEQTYLSGLNLDDTTSILSTGSTNELASVPGVYPIVGLTRAEARSLAANRGSVWRQLDFTLWSAVQLLYLVEYQTFNSQSVLGNGNTNDSYPTSSSNQAVSPHSIAGRSNSLGNASTDTTSGANTVTNPPTAFMSYRGIENFYGNAWQWADGINVNVGGTGNAHVTNNRADFADNTSTSMTLLTDSWPTGNNYISLVQNVDHYFAPLSTSDGSSSTYITDYSYGSSDSNRIVRVGGLAFLGDQNGVFTVATINSSSQSFRVIGARLTC